MQSAVDTHSAFTVFKGVSVLLPRSLCASPLLSVWLLHTHGLSSDAARPSVWRPHSCVRRNGIKSKQLFGFSWKSHAPDKTVQAPCLCHKSASCWRQMSRTPLESCWVEGWGPYTPPQLPAPKSTPAPQGSGAPWDAPLKSDLFPWIHQQGLEMPVSFRFPHQCCPLS